MYLAGIHSEVTPIIAEADIECYLVGFDKGDGFVKLTDGIVTKIGELYYPPEPLIKTHGPGNDAYYTIISEAILHSHLDHARYEISDIDAEANFFAWEVFSIYKAVIPAGTAYYSIPNHIGLLDTIGYFASEAFIIIEKVEAAPITLIEVEEIIKKKST